MRQSGCEKKFVVRPIADSEPLKSCIGAGIEVALIVLILNRAGGGGV